MKKIELVSRNEVLFVGNAREICSLYKNFLRRGIAEPSFCDFPQFNMARFYGLCISYYDDWNDEYYSEPRMMIVAGDTALAIICNL